MIYTYSPNWYRAQCIHFIEGRLYYSSNYLLYEYDLALRGVLREMCFRQVAMEHAMNHRDIKINAIASLDTQLIVALNQNYIVLLDQASFKTIRVVDLGIFIADYLYLHSATLAMVSKQGTFLRYEVNSEDPSKSIQLKSQSGPVKAMYPLDKSHIAFYTKGLILWWDSSLEAVITSLELLRGEVILSVDMREGTCCMLTRIHDKLQVSIFQANALPPLGVSRIQQIGTHFKRFSVVLQYPKNYAEKLRQCQKASMVLKIWSQKEVILSGKLGEVFSIDPEQARHGSTLTLKPYSLEETAVTHRVWSDSKHFKEIYAIYEHRAKLYMLGTDHRLTVWHPSHGQLRCEYSMRFLTAGALSVFFSEEDPNTIFVLLKDSIIRSCSPLEEGSHCLNQYWKFVKKFTIKKAVCHTKEEGVVALQTACDRILIYDLYEDRLMKVMEVPDPISSVSFEPKGIREALMSLSQGSCREEKCVYVSHFAKEMSDDYELLIQCRLYFLLINGLASKELSFLKISKECKLERIHNNSYWDTHFLLASHCKQSILHLSSLAEGRKSELDLPLRYVDGRYTFKYPRHSNKLIVINYKGKELSIWEFNVAEEGSLRVDRSKEVAMPHFADTIHLNYWDDRVALYSKRDDILQILRIEDCFQAVPQAVKAYDLRAKIQCLSFYLTDYLVIGGKDQSVRVIKLDGLELLSRKGKKEV